MKGKHQSDVDISVSRSQIRDEKETFYVFTKFTKYDYTRYQRLFERDVNKGTTIEANAQISFERVGCPEQS